MIWNSKNSTYYSKGRKRYGLGDKLPPDVIAQMGAGTLAEYIERGLIANDKSAAKIIEPAAVSEKDALIEKAKNLGLNPHYKAGIPKLKAMIEDHEALQALKEKALSLDILVRDDVTFEELTILVADEKEAMRAIDDESDR